MSAPSTRSSLLRPAEKGPVKTALEGLAKIGRALRAIAYGFSGKAKVSVPGFGEIEAGFVAKEMIDRYEKLQAQDDPLIQRTLYYHAFETLGAATGAEGPNRPKIAVFVDDLDRCFPPQGVKLLESIKLVLSQPGFIFVLGLDRRIIEDYLVKRYRDDFGFSAYQEGGKSYLDKIIQLPLPLPPHRSRFEQYILRLLDRPTFQGANEPVREALKGLVGVLAVGSNFNPRNLVRFINNLIVDRNIWVALQQQKDPSVKKVHVAAELLGLCAVSRILRQHLGDALYNFLVGSNDTCAKLAAGPEGWQELLEETRRAPPNEVSPRQKWARSLLLRLDDLPFLRDLLSTNAGRGWLVEHDQRGRVNEFLVEQREETREEPKSSEQIIEEAIRRELQKPEGPITEEERESIVQLDLSKTQVSDLSSLATLSSLRVLYLNGTQVRDVFPLGGLANLRVLYLGETQVAEVSPLGRLRSLEILYLSDTPVSDVSALAGLTNLERLYLAGTQVSDVSCLAALRNLEKLDLRETQVTQTQIDELKKALPNRSILR